LIKKTYKNLEMKQMLISVLAGVLGLLAFTASGEPLKIVLPPETSAFRVVPGAEIAMAQCLQCHSAEYITTQPRLGRNAWKASIEKMRAKYGAVVPSETEVALLEYLVGTYGTP
jgi:mono/diheme cytochrome c family protein